MKRQTLIGSLSGVCAILGAALLYLTFAPLPDEQPQQITLPHKPPPVLEAQSITMPPPAAFTALDSHPAFNPGRAPLATSQVSSGTQTPPDVKVVGVIIDGANRIAMIRAPASPLAIAFQIGATISGWHIAEIEPDRVVLTSGGLRDEIRLDANRPVKSGP
ncbi:MAG TPA: hypothetical protein VMF66_17005 [Candidatus Acidoferrum sp.]|nr:hypothetical protein [Candidatus Acidoferrum sp.]